MDSRVEQQQKTRTVGCSLCAWEGEKGLECLLQQDCAVPVCLSEGELEKQQPQVFGE